jgi:hypothetical protein
MTFTERTRLLAFGLVTWMTGMFSAADPDAVAVTLSCAPVMAGIGAGLFTTALLPGRMARFS